MNEGRARKAPDLCLGHWQAYGRTLLGRYLAFLRKKDRPNFPGDAGIKILI